MSYYKNDEQAQVYAQLVARAWSDPKFKDELIKNPVSVLKNEFNIEVPKGINLQGRENTDKVFHLALDAAPASQEARLAVDELSAASTFGSAGTLGTAGTACGTFGTAACLGTAGSWEL